MKVLACKCVLVVIFELFFVCMNLGVRMLVKNTII